MERISLKRLTITAVLFLVAILGFVASSNLNSVEAAGQPPSIVGVGDKSVVMSGSPSNPNNEYFLPMLYVKATDAVDGDITNKVIVTGEVNTKVPGVYPITYSVTNSLGLTTTVTRNITMVDNVAPTIIGAFSKANLKISSLNYKPGKNVTVIDNVDGDITNKLVIDYPANYDLNVPGVYSLTFSATDAAGNRGYCVRSVTVIGAQFGLDQVPTITGADDIIIKTNSTFDYLAGVKANDLEDGDITRFNEYSGTVDTKVNKTYQITYRVEDSAGNVTTKIRNVRVASGTTLLGVGNKSVVMSGSPSNPNNEYFLSLLYVTAKDPLDGDITDKIVVTGAVNTKVPGVYLLTYTVTNSLGLTTTVVREITMVDDIKPVISGINSVANHKAGTPYNPIANAVVIDNVDGDITSKLIVEYPANYDLNVPGVYSLIFTATDAAGNVGVIVRSITVIK